MVQRDRISIVLDEQGLALALARTIASLELPIELFELQEADLDSAQLGRAALLPCELLENGAAILRRVRERHGHLPVLFFCSNPSREHIEHAVSEGALGVLSVNDPPPIVERFLNHALSHRAMLLSQAATNEAKLSKAVERLLDSQSIAHVGSFELNAMTGQVERTPEFCRILGIDPTDPPMGIGLYLSRVHADDRPRVREEMNAAFAGKRPLDSRHRLVHSNGDVLFVHARGRFEHDASGRVLRAFGVVQDETEMRCLQQQVESFVHSVAHDLRSPLGIIIGFAELLQEDMAAAALTHAKDYADNILTTGQRMQRMIAAFLNLSRSAHAPLERIDVDLSELAVMSFRRLAKRAKHANERVLRVEGQLAAHGDASLLEILLTNLLDNAIKYTAQVAQPEIRVGKAATKEGDAYFVSDNGVGFPPEEAGRLFAPFIRLHKRADFEGSGLGLATCDRIVRRHGGRIWVETKQGTGTTFFFTLGAHEEVSDAR